MSEAGRKESAFQSPDSGKRGDGDSSFSMQLTHRFSRAERVSTAFIFNTAAYSACEPLRELSPSRAVQVEYSVGAPADLLCTAETF